MDAAYDLDRWHDLLIGTLGASAALLGLFFVAISMHPAHILEHPVLRWNAAISATGLSVTLLASVLGLAPQVDERAFGAAVIALNLAQVVVFVQGWRWPRRWSRGRSVRTALSVANLAVIFFAGIAMLMQRWGGMYWLLPPLLFSFGAHLFNAWGLLFVSEARARMAGAHPRN